MTKRIVRSFLVGLAAGIGLGLVAGMVGIAIGCVL